jgi:hypothetical protein
MSVRDVKYVCIDPFEADDHVMMLLWLVSNRGAVSGTPYPRRATSSGTGVLPARPA